MCGYYSICRSGICGNSPKATLGCLAAGTKCFPCARVNVVESSATYQTQLGANEAHGALDEDFGWTIEDGAGCGLQAADFVVKVNGNLTTEATMGALSDDTSDVLVFKFYRPGISGLQTLTVTRS